MPNNNNNNNNNNSSNPLFPNLPQLNLPAARKPSGGAQGANGNAASPAGSAPSPASGNSNLADLHAQLQARMLQSQQQVNAATRQRAASGNGPQPGGNAPNNMQPKLNGLPDWANMAAASSALGGLGPGIDREAIMKQLQLLHQARGPKQQSSVGPGTPAMGGTAPSPAAVTAPSPATVTAPSPAPNAGTPGAQVPPYMNAASPVTAPSPAAAALAAAIRPPGTPQSASGLSLAGGLAGQAGTPGGSAPPRPPVRPGQQRQHLINSMMGFYKTINQIPPPEVFNNGEKDGAFKLGDGWIDIAELFFIVFRAGGMMKLVQTPSPEQHLVWQQILNAKSIPVTLTNPVPLPRPMGMDPSQPTQTTTNAVQYLFAAYRAWVFGFEQAMARQKLVHMQKQQALAATAGVRPALSAASPKSASSPAAPTMGAPTPSVAAPSPVTVAAPSPAVAVASPTFAAPSPAVAAHSPAMAVPSPAPFVQQPVAVASPIASLTTATPAVPNAPSPAVESPAQPQLAPSPFPPSQPAVSTLAAQSEPRVPPPQPRIEIPVAPSPAPPVAMPAVATTPTPSMLASMQTNIHGAAAKAESVSAKKRKRSEKMPAKSSTPGSAAESTSSPAPKQQAYAKRARYRVEYRPLHFPQPTMAGWDERVVAASFPKHNLGRPTHSAAELGQIDMEAILMGLRSRLPGELSYALTVLSMLSMPQHDDRIPQLPIQPMLDVYLELIDLIGESALGEEGVDGWLSDKEKTEAAEAPSRRASPARDDLSWMSYVDLERLGHDTDLSVDEEDTSKDRTGGATDIVLAGLNIIRNFSYNHDNGPVMACPQLINLLAAVTDMTLARMPGTTSDRQPYSILELARVRREAVSIMTNLANHFDVRRTKASATLAVFRLVTSFLVSGWETLRLRESGYGPSISIREVPPLAVLSIDRALEAFSRLALADHNREVLATLVPTDELVELFSSLVKLLPISTRDKEAMLSIEDYLGRVELGVMSVYSLAFLAPTAARAGMRASPGAIAVLTRLVCDLAPRAPNLKQSPFGFLVRRVAETLAVLNGTMTPSGNAESMSFAAGGVEGKGWRFANEVVQPGWLAADSDRLLEAMGWGKGDGRIWQVDAPTFAELDGLFLE
ncbi:uncharacterized protein CcaverHIS019_0601200 [Cutaneotrichosporon cavernicola]|uniref:ARID domain-containing protein n=1 Tax=Cutaneotrichosporon cavernicola TaxID=279322 RepID=A0AA48QXR5_9TREE|nr:uncharacterized protein CcaverHIS019_0601200 [Cutaneotrichosporon cavernicola]BEI93661.1 hypothetical protein CcaverHIS019_0601200 [Cutaneotrichosporon cavernicola]